ILNPKKIHDERFSSSWIKQTQSRHKTLSAEVRQSTASVVDSAPHAERIFQNPTKNKTEPTIN
ncbi:hypothetical protein OAL55_05905, partial [Verrucomicrobiales bacterium]|nr:hypothetical protein [Verrucomicrobiales bacterium]